MDYFYIGTWKTDSEPARLMVFRSMDRACIQTMDLPGNLSFVKLDREKKLLYVLINGDPEVHGGCGGVLNIYRVGENGTLRLVQKCSTFGAEPIELALLNTAIAVVNHGSTTNRVCRTRRLPDGSPETIWVYDEASLVLLERLPDGSVGKLLDQHEFVGHGEIPFFQESAAPHSIFLNEENNLLLIPERGSDRISVFSVENGHLDLKAELPEKRGYGPRNAAMTRDGQHIYVVDEIMPSVSHYRAPFGEAVQRVDTVSRQAASECDDDPRLFSAPHPVALWLSGNEKYGYTLTRSTETLSVFRRDAGNGCLEMIQEWKLSGVNPRQAIADGNRLYIVLMDTRSLAELTVEEATGKILEERILLDGIDAIAAVDGM